MFNFEIFSYAYVNPEPLLYTTGYYVVLFSDGSTMKVRAFNGVIFN